MNSAIAIAGVVIKEMYRRKDFYVLFILTALITLLLGSVNFFNDPRIARYMKEVCLLLIWICSLVMAIATTARQIPAEKENRTVFPLLAKPVTRWQVLCGKFLGCWFSCGMALVMFYAFFVFISGIREHHWPLVIYIQALWMHWFMLGILVAMSLLGSIVFAAPSSNTTICLIVSVGILLVGRHLHKASMQLPEPTQTILYALYFAIPHLDFYDMRDLIIHDWSPVAWWVILVATLYAAAYTSLFLGLSWLAFRRKALN